MEITIDDYFILVDRVEPEKWRYNPLKDPTQGEAQLAGYIDHKQRMMSLILATEPIYSKGGLFSSPSQIGQRYTGTVSCGTISGKWEYVHPIDEHRVAEEGDSRLETKFNEVVDLIGDYLLKERKKDNAAIKDILSSGRGKQ
jgi:hypothetical protein